LCACFKVSRQAYYKQASRDEGVAKRDTSIVQKVQQIRVQHTMMGGKKLFKLLHNDIEQLGGGVGRDKFFGILRQADLLVKRRRRYARTTQSHHRFRVYKNLMADFSPQAPHQAWVCDITYVRLMGDRFAYLFLVTDAYSRKIVGWQLKESLGLEGALKAVDMAIKQCPVGSALIHHSDRGFQYCSHQYVKRLKQNGIQISMAEAGNCYQNAMAERMNGILKAEYGLDETFAGYRQALEVTRQSIRNYNENRPHWSLDLRMPADVHAEKNIAADRCLAFCN
jgi:putative transposase